MIDQVNGNDLLFFVIVDFLAQTFSSFTCMILHYAVRKFINIHADDIAQYARVIVVKRFKGLMSLRFLYLLFIRIINIVIHGLILLLFKFMLILIKFGKIFLFSFLINELMRIA